MYTLLSMRGSRIFRRGVGGGGGPGQSDIKSPDNVFKVPEGVQHFPGGGGSNFFQGGPIAYTL